MRATELPKSIGKRVNGRQVYSVAELLQVCDAPRGVSVDPAAYTSVVDLCHSSSRCTT